ncbi:MAG: response regulator [Atopobiaceae bacterium]|nr:response regulator [Atopobiaceae bacterium]
MKKRLSKSLSVRLPLLFAASVLVIMGVMIPVVYMRFHNRMIEQYTRMAQGVTQLMVNAFDGDKVDEYIQKNTELPEYSNTIDYLYSLRDNYPDILYMYIYRFEEDGGHIVIDLDADWWENGEGYPVGSVWSLNELEEPFASHLHKIMEGEEIAGYSELTKEDGYLFTYTRPIFKSDGSYACTACVDFSMDNLKSMDIAFTLGLSLALLGIGAIVLIADIFIVRKRITMPINELSNCVSNFAYDTEEDRKRNIERLDELNIRTGDEIEVAYHALQSVTRDNFEATASLTQALDDIHDRDGLITAMAADYRSVYYADLDKDECVCYRASSVMPNRMWAGKEFFFTQGFTEYAQHCVAEEDRALAEALTRAEEASAAKTAFLSSMSHEIRTPMNAIIGLDNIALHDSSISLDTRESLQKIGSSARHLLSLINDILDMSRIESGRMQLKEDEFSFPQMVEQINTIINGQCEDKGLVYSSRVAEGVDEYFVGDDLRLKQILINILGNAVKFTDSPGTVSFDVVEEPNAPATQACVAGLHALIAEDQEMNAEVLADLLDLEEITSEWAQNSQIAVEMFNKSEVGHFGAILMDMRMPVMDGLDATKEIRALDRPDARAVPIIALTANAFEEDVRDCLSEGMDAHLSKHVDIDLLTSTLAQLLAAR